MQRVVSLHKPWQREQSFQGGQALALSSRPNAQTLGLLEAISLTTNPNQLSSHPTIRSRALSMPVASEFQAALAAMLLAGQAWYLAASATLNAAHKMLRAGLSLAFGPLRLGAATGQVRRRAVGATT